MFSLRVLFQFLLVVTFGLCIASCSEGDVNTESDFSQNIHEPDAANMLSGNRSPQDSGDSLDVDEAACFDFVYPLVIVYPDGSTASIDNDDALESLLETWFDQNQDAQQGPEFQYPITVDTSGSQLILNDEEEFCALLASCYDDEFDEYAYEDEYDEDYMEDDEMECFEVIFPITVVMPDGTTIEIANEEALEEVFEIDDSEIADSLIEIQLPEIQYPITVQLPDGTEQSVNDGEALDELFIDCFGDYADDEYEDCITIQYPVDIQFPDGSLITVVSVEEEENAIDQFYEMNSDAEASPEYIFPITIFQSDGMEQSVANSDDLEALYEACEELESDNQDGDGGDGDDADDDNN